MGIVWGVGHGLGQEESGLIRSRALWREGGTGWAGGCFAGLHGIVGARRLCQFALSPAGGLWPRFGGGGHTDVGQGGSKLG